MTSTVTEIEEQVATAIRLAKLNNVEDATEQESNHGSIESQPTIKLSRTTFLKLISAAYAFFVAGVNDGSIGALIPYIIRQHDITTALVSSVYAASFAGWLIAAFSNTHLAQHLQLGDMLALGAILQVLAHALRVWLPPFPLFAVTFGIASLGQAYQDTHANTFVASVRAAHRWLGFIHAMYMAGCLVGPFTASAVASSRDPSLWNLFYTIPLGLGVVNVVLVMITFRESIQLLGKSKVVAAVPEPAANDEELNNKGAGRLIKESLRTPSLWLLSLFYFCYLGAVLTASGWVVEYLVVVRGGDLAKMGYVPAGSSGGALLGRLLLPEPTNRLGERRMVFIYCVLCIGLQLLFWLVPNIIAASVAVSLTGFFSGPLFATGISVGSKLFSPVIHSTALAFVFVIAQMGGSIFPIVTGVIASHAGVGILQPVLVGLFCATAVSWLLVPRPKESGNTALHQE